MLSQAKIDFGRMVVHIITAIGYNCYIWLYEGYNSRSNFMIFCHRGRFCYFGYEGYNIKGIKQRN